MTLTIVATIWVCSDCTIAAVNADTSGLSDERTLQLWSRMPWADVTPWDYDETETDPEVQASIAEHGTGRADFTHDCDACGVRLYDGFTRFAVWA